VLQIDRQTKRSFKTPEAARSAATPKLTFRHFAVLEYLDRALLDDPAIQAEPSLFVNGDYEFVAPAGRICSKKRTAIAIDRPIGAFQDIGGRRQIDVYEQPNDDRTEADDRDKCSSERRGA
jgi:hypothetical protein